MIKAGLSNFIDANDWAGSVSVHELETKARFEGRIVFHDLNKQKIDS